MQNEGFKIAFLSRKVIWKKAKKTNLTWKRAKSVIWDIDNTVNKSLENYTKYNKQIKNYSL